VSRDGYFYEGLNIFSVFSVYELVVSKSFKSFSLPYSRFLFASFLSKLWKFHGSRKASPLKSFSFTSEIFFDMPKKLKMVVALCLFVSKLDIKNVCSSYISS
jgi:hypothetical protein